MNNLLKFEVVILILVATIGMKMDLTLIFENTGLIAIGFIWMSIHALLLILVAKLIKAPYFFLAVGSQANVGGAASAPIVASAFHPSLATVGVLSNPDNKNIKLGKAGRNRYLGKRPKVRGVVMNPVDHPHGGGEGRTSGGRHPVTPWGVSTKGKKTRRNKKTNVFIIKRRKK